MSFSLRARHSLRTTNAFQLYVACTTASLLSLWRTIPVSVCLQLGSSVGTDGSTASTTTSVVVSSVDDSVWGLDEDSETGVACPVKAFDRLLSINGVSVSDMTAEQVGESVRAFPSAASDCRSRAVDLFRRRVRCLSCCTSQRSRISH
jgi:hypothetical protein